MHLPMTVSVVIPAHNAGSFIDEAIRSVLVQDWPVEAIIVVNDGSSDRDYSQLAELSDSVRVCEQPNRGVSAARNLGCRLVSSEYVAILDADDLWLPGKLRAQMTHLAANRGCDAVFCQGTWWYPTANDAGWPRPEDVAVPVPSAAPARRLYYSDFIFGLPVATSTMVVKRGVWLALGGFDESRRYAEDQDFNLRLAYRHRVDLIDAPAVLYRQHRASATRKLQDANHWADVISAAGAKLGLEDGSRAAIDPLKLRRRLAELHVFHGRDHFWRGDIDVAWREFRRAFVNRPFDARTAAYLVLSGLPGVPQLLRRAFRQRAVGGKTYARLLESSGRHDSPDPRQTVPPQ